MTYDTYEISAQDGAPVELYEFDVDDVTYRYTSFERDYVVGILVYKALPIERGEIQETGDLPKNELEITVARDFEVAEFFRVAPPSNVVVARLYEVHRTDGDQQLVVKWSGRVLSVNWQGARATLYCENSYTSLKRPGLRRAYSRMCPHVLYGNRCRADKDTFVESITIGSVSGATLVSDDFDALDDGFFDGGYVEWERTPGVFDRRAIRSHVGDTITLTHAFPSSLSAGATVNAYPGCDHTFETCQSKFNNTDNFGGFPNMPSKNPFDPNPVF